MPTLVIALHFPYICTLASFTDMALTFSSLKDGFLDTLSPAGHS
jgi:hypothetical protein